MIVTVSTGELRDALRTCAAAISARPYMPLLAGVLLKVEPQDEDPLAEAAQPLVLRAFDGETDVIARVSARVDSAEHPVALPSHRLLTAIAAAATGASMTFTTETPSGQRLIVTSGRSSWKLPSMHHGDYPAPMVVPDVSGSLSGLALRQAVEQVAEAGGDDKSPGPCQLMSIERGTGGRGTGVVELICTDRYRMHTGIVPVKWDQTPDVSDIRVPARKIAQIVKPLDDEVVRIGWTDHLLTFQTDHVTITTTLAADAETWLPWRSFFEDTGGDPMVFDAAELVTAVKQAGLVIEESKATPVKLTLGREPSECLVYAAEHDADSAVPVEVKYDGPECTITINGDMLATAVDAACPDGGQVQLAQVKTGKPLLIGADGGPASHIVMPMRAPRERTGT